MSPTTRHQAAIAEGRLPPDQDSSHGPSPKPTKRQSKSTSHKMSLADTEKSNTSNARDMQHTKREHPSEEAKEEHNADSEIRPSKRVKPDTSIDKGRKPKFHYQSGTIERGHIYFFYRPRVELTEVESIDDVRNFHILLVPRPPDFAARGSSQQDVSEKQDPAEAEHFEMKVLATGADAVPASNLVQSKANSYRLITVGKKKLPDPDATTPGSGRKKETFWATVTAVGSDFASLDKGLGEKSYETKTRGTRHEAPVRLVARGGYAIVNSEAEIPSKRETHLGYHVSHPDKADFGDVQKAFGILPASSFVLQVKNPLAPATGPQQAHSKGADYPRWILQDIFGTAVEGEKETRGREHYGLRFASCETPELLNYKGAQLLLIAAREGEEGLETSLGEGRGIALTEKEEEEAHKSVEEVFQELGLDLDQFPVESLEGSWV